MIDFMMNSNKLEKTLTKSTDQKIKKRWKQ